MADGSRLWHRRWLMAILLVSAVALLPGIAASQRVLVDSPGMWSLERLGYGERLIAVNQRVEGTTVQYLLPENAGQGGERWYLTHLDAEVEVSPDSGDGFAILGVGTNDRASIMVTINVRHESGRAVVEWDTVDLVDGTRHQRADTFTFQLHDVNYMQYGGVVPGLNTMVFSVEQFRDVRVKLVRIQPTSGVVVSTLAPASLRLEVEPARVEAAVGESFVVRYTLTNRGGMVARGVKVTAMPTRDSFEQIDEHRVEGELATGESRRGDITFRASKEGRFQIYLVGSSTTATDGAMVSVVVGTPPPEYPTTLTVEQTERAKAIVLADDRVQQIASGSPIEFKGVGLWELSGETRRPLGASAYIGFPRTVTVPAGFPWPRAMIKPLTEILANPSEPAYTVHTYERDAVELSGLLLEIDLDRAQVVGIHLAP